MADPTDRVLAGLRPYTAELAVVAINALREVGLPAVAVSGTRSQAEQDRLYAQGRTRPGRIVTWTRRSAHVAGKSIDIAFLIDGRITWDVPSEWWDAVGAVGDVLGARWGGRFSTPDKPHLEWR